MASKLELRFTEEGIEKAYITINGQRFTFVTNRLGGYQIEIDSTPLGTAGNFAASFNADYNYTDSYTIGFYSTQLDATGAEITGDPHGIVEIEHPDNTHFDSFTNTAVTFITHTITTTTQEVEPTIEVSYGQATDACGKYKLILATNKTEGKIYIEHPIGVDIAEVVLDGSPTYELEFTRPSMYQRGIIKYFAGERTSRGAAEVFFYPPPVISITSVDITGSPFGAFASVKSTGINLQYSLDNITYQGSKEWTRLLAGSYTAYVKDNLGCTKSKTFTVTEDQASGLTVPPFIRVPVHNSIHFVKRGGNSLLNYLSTEMPGYIQIQRFYQDYVKGNVVATQFKSSYPTNRAFLIDELGNETEITVLKKSDNINRINILEGNYTEKNGRVAVHFTSGNVYNPDNSVAPEGHNLNGTLPHWYEEGVYLDIEGLGVTRIEYILNEEGINYAITQLEPAGTVAGKKITSIHTADPYEIYEFDAIFSQEGIFQIRIDFGAGFYLSELIRIHEKLPETYLLTQWWNENNNDINYNTGIKHYRWIEWEKYFELVPRAEKETYDTDTTVKLINSKTFAVYSLTLQAQPMEVARGLQVGWDNSGTIVINGAVFVCEPAMKLDPSGQWYYPTAELTLTDQTMEGQQDVTTGIIPEFLALEQNDDGVVLLRL